MKMPSLRIAASAIALASTTGSGAMASSLSSSLSPKFAERMILDDNHRNFVSAAIQHYNADRRLNSRPVFSPSIHLHKHEHEHYGHEPNRNRNNPHKNALRRTEQVSEEGFEDEPLPYPYAPDEEDKKVLACDVSFMSCLTSTSCTKCFSGMTDEDIDWSIIAPGTPCDGVLNALIEKTKICHDLSDVNSDDRKIFCQAFDSCVIWNDDDDENEDPDGGGDGDNNNNIINPTVDCDSLTKCEFDGFKPNYLGDGICHEFIGGCYNHAICGYDGGDCCADTCQNRTSASGGGGGGGADDDGSFHLGCGTDGYFCRDPKSELCESLECKKNKNNDSADGSGGGRDKPISPKDANCTSDEIPYRLYQFDSFGDGWDLTEMIITSQDGKDIIYDGRLEDGSEGMELICLKNTPACYNAKLNGGYWGNEVSWEIKPMKNGAPALASGGSPMDCNFPISAVDECELTCTGRPNLDPKMDEKYQNFHRMVDCINDKCVLQIETCKNELVCSSCLQAEDEAPAYCLSSNYYNALVFCTECNCIEDIDIEEKKRFCEDKSRDPHENQDSVREDDETEDGGTRECSFSDFMDGTDALIQYKTCSGFDTTYALVTEFDNDNFGMIDAFESCAHDYKKSKYGKSALECMRILDEATIHPQVDPNKKGVPVEAIKKLASDLLNDGETFCNCSAKASQGTPPCYDFLRFKTLLYESLDGCRALDEIDCAAWGEYYTPCNANLKDKFGNVDLRESKQCEYVKNRCGNIGPFPSFRRLDCDSEGVSKEAWDFYLEYENHCMKDVTPPNPAPKPYPSPNPPSPKTYTSEPTVAPKPSPTPPYKPSSPEKKKYVPKEERGKKGYFKKFFHFLLFCIIGVLAYRAYILKFGGFNYASFRRSRDYYADDGSGMYDSLNLQTTGETSFMPPSLPPPPSAYEQQNYSYPNPNPNPINYNNAA